MMTLGFAFVAAIVYLAWLLDRPRLLLPALVLSRRASSSGLSLSGHDARRPRLVVATELADWVHISAASLWLGGLVALAVAVWPARPELRRRRSSASPGSRRCSSRSSSPPGRTSASCGSRT